MYWLPLYPHNTTKLDNLREMFFQELPKETQTNLYNPENFPHITILPGFTASDIEEIESGVDHLDTPIKVTFDEYDIWPSIDNPMVISLHPKNTEQLEEMRETALDCIEENGTLYYDPKPFHLTLFRGGNSGEEDEFTVPDETKQVIQNIVNQGVGLPITITFDTIKCSEWKI